MPQQVPRDPGRKVWSYLQSQLGTSSATSSDLAVGYLRTYLTGVDPVESNQRLDSQDSQQSATRLRL